MQGVHQRPWLVTVALALLFLLLAPLPGAVRAQGEDLACGHLADGFYESPHYAYVLSWRAPWTVEACFSEADYDVLGLTTGISDLVLEGAPNPAPTPEACVENEYQRLSVREDVADLTLLEESAFPMVGWAGAGRLYTYELRTEDGAQAVFGHKWCTLLEDGVSLVITQIGPVGELETQLAVGGVLLAGLRPSALSVAAPPQPDRAARRAELRADLDAAIRDVNAFWDRTYPTLPLAAGEAFTPPTDYVLFDTPITACNTRIEPGSTPFYCRAERTVYIDVVAMEFFQAEYGSFLPATVVAHEVGHHVQELLALQECVESPCLDEHELTSMEFENMADCFAGAWASDAEQRGRLQSFDIERALIAHVERTGDPIGVGGADPGAHGRGARRAYWFLQGYYFPIETCFAASPATANPSPP